MPQRITKSRLMRSRAISTPPPICLSKSKTYLHLHVCNCEPIPTCTDINERGHTFPSAMQTVAQASAGTQGTWSYTDKEHQINESGAWNNCVLTGTLRIYYEPPPLPDWNPSELIDNVLTSQILDLIANRVAHGLHGRWRYIPEPTGTEQTGTF